MKFKQEKNLRSHLLQIHSIDQMKERYCEEKNKITFKCGDCDLEFSYKKSLAVHRKNKHEGHSFYECKTCHSRFTYKQNLVRHVNKKHRT